MPSQLQFTLGDAMRKSRTQPQHGHRLSQAVMAEQLHVSRPTIGAWEKGETAVPFWAVKAWAQITGWPMEWFDQAAELPPGIHGLSSPAQPSLFEYAA